MIRRQLPRYIGVQVLAYALDMGTFLLLTRALALGPLWANVVGKLAAGALAFVLHRRLTFADQHQGSVGPQLLRYGVLLALNVPVASGLLWLALPWLSPPALAKFAADVASVALSFMLSRHLVFRSAAPPGTPPA